MSHPISTSLCFALAVSLALPSTGSAQFTRLVDSFDTIPGKPGSSFVVFAEPPALAGNVVLFAHGAGDHQELWRVSADGGAPPVRVVASDRPVPDGSGVFGTLFPFAHDGTRAVFRGVAPGQGGLYAVSLGGGAVTTLVNEDDQVPGEPAGTLFGVFAGSSGIDLDGDTLIFQMPGIGHGLFAVEVDGGGVESLANDNFQHCEDGYGLGGVYHWGAVTPDLDGDTVVAQVWNTDGHQLVLTLPLGGVLGADDPCALFGRARTTNTQLVASANSPVPEDPLGRDFSIHQIGGPLLEGGVVVFLGAADSGVPFFYDHAGIYSAVPHRGTSGLIKLVDNETAVPGGNGNFALGGTDGELIPPEYRRGYALDGGRVVFMGQDRDGVWGLYEVSALGGEIARIIAVGDSLGDDRTVTELHPPIGPHSLDGRRLVFRVEFHDETRGLGGHGIYITGISGLIFGDEFETGGTERWSITVP